MAFPSNPTEQALQVAIDDQERVGEFLGTLASDQVWIPLPEGAGSQPDGSFALPTVEFEEHQLIPVFTSEEQLTAGAPEDCEHIVVPVAEMVHHFPDGVGMAINPGGAAGMPIPAEVVKELADELTKMQEGVQVTIDHPAEEPTELLEAVGKSLANVPHVVSASRAWIDVEEAGEGLILGIELDDPSDEQAQQQALDAIQHVVEEVQPEFSLDVTFSDQEDDDPIDEWMLDNTEPFYAR